MSIALIGLMIAFASGAAMSKDSDGSDDSDRSDDLNRIDDSGNEIKGKIEQISENRTGIWIVNGREITVTDKTFIDEEHGKAKVGVYVEVKGNQTSDSFIATKIEVKRMEQQSS